MNLSLVCFWAMCLLFGSVALVRAAAAASPEAKSDDEVRIPPEYAREKLKRYPNQVSPGRYRVVVDVPPGKRTGHVTKSSGNKAVDAVALDFADAYATQIKSLREMHRSRELRFPLVFDLPSVPAGTWQTKVPRGALSARVGRYQTGTLMVRVVSGADGRLKSAKMVVSTGSSNADSALEYYALRHWSGPPSEATIVRAEFIIGR